MSKIVHQEKRDGVIIEVVEFENKGEIYHAATASKGGKIAHSFWRQGINFVANQAYDFFCRGYTKPQKKTRETPIFRECQSHVVSQAEMEEFPDYTIWNWNND